MSRSTGASALEESSRTHEDKAAFPPGRAILTECRWCKGGGRWECKSTKCHLNGSGSALQRIRRHCLDCIARDEDESAKAAVLRCDGRVIGGTGGHRVCPLHPFRLGKNPRRKGVGRPGGGPILANRVISPISRTICASRTDDLDGGNT